MTYVAEWLGKMGGDQHIGHAFAITTARLEDEYAGNFATIEWPAVDYDYAVFHDDMTENYLVARPNANGEYDAMFERLTKVR